MIEQFVKEILDKTCVVMFVIISKWYMLLFFHNSVKEGSVARFWTKHNFNPWNPNFVQNNYQDQLEMKTLSHNRGTFNFLL